MSIRLLICNINFLGPLNNSFMSFLGVAQSTEAFEYFSSYINSQVSTLTLILVNSPNLQYFVD